MKGNNMMAKTEFLVINSCFAMMATLLYKYSLYIPLVSFSAATSSKIFFAFFAILLVAGVLFTMENDRDYFSILLNVIIPLQLYAALTYIRYYPWLIVPVVVVCAVLSLTFFGLVVFRKINSDADYKQIVKKRLIYACHGIRTVLVCGLCIVMVPIMVKGEGIYHVDKDIDSAPVQSEQWTIANNIETVMNIKEDMWSTLTAQEKMDTLGVFKNIELRYLGVNYSVGLVADILSENVLGQYDYDTRTITIDADLIKTGSGEEVLKVLVHECHHAYTRQVVEAYNTVPEEYKKLMIFNSARQLETEYENYVDHEDDPQLYAKQYCELSANVYANEAVADYMKKIDEYEKSIGAAVN